MSTSLPEIYLARHGETAWTISRQHTGLTDIPLLKQGENDAIQLGRRLQGREFTKVLVSPPRTSSPNLRTGRLRRQGRGRSRAARVGLR